MIKPVPTYLFSLLTLITGLIVVSTLTACVNKSNTSAQPTAPPVTIVREYVEAKEKTRYQALLASYGQNKSLPSGFELQALLALSHYPALKEVTINFIIDDVGIPISSRPHWASMGRSASKRTYQVIIDSHREGRRGALLLKNQPFNAQVGIIGHELAHSVYYLDRSFLGIIIDAVCQLSDCRIQFERKADQRLIDSGLGWQRIDHAKFVRGRFNLEPSMRQPASSFVPEITTGAYMSPYELLQLMADNPVYNSSLEGSVL